MDLRYYPVRPDLRELFGVYYSFESAGHVHQPICAELGNIRIVLDGAGGIHWPDGRSAHFTEATVVGPTMSAYAVTATPGTRVFGIGILPYGWDALFGFSAAELTDRICNLRDCFGPANNRLVNEMTERMKGARDWRECAAIADHYLQLFAMARLDKIKRFPAGLEDWLLNPDRHGLDELVDLMDVSRRQTDRLAKYYFGASPKALQRKYRALHTLTRMSLGADSTWWEENGHGFYDQSHFIKEFKTFVGATPTQFLGDGAVLMAKSIQMRSRATHKPPLKHL